MALVTVTSGALVLATDLQTFLAAAKVRLFKDGAIVIGPNTTKAELVALECDYTGYAEATVATWLGPMLAPISGAMVQSPTLIFSIDAPYTVGNSVQGWWLEDAAGDLLMIGTPTASIPLTGPGQMWTFNIAVGTGANP